MEHRESVYCDSLATQNSTENRLMLSYSNLSNKDQDKVPEVPPIIRLPGCPMPTNTIELKSMAPDKIELVTGVERCKQIVAKLEREKVLAVATEGINVGKEGPLTLLQIGTCSGHVYIFDVLENRDLFHKGRLKIVLESENIIKVMHQSSNVSAALNYQFAVTLTKVFDTQVAHLVISEHKGRRLPSGLKLSEICLQYVDNVDKFYTYDWRTDSKIRWMAQIGTFWATRPLTSEMLEFASGDVIVLIPDVFNHQLHYIAAASAHIHAFLESLLPVHRTIYFPSHWLLSHITIVETMVSGGRGMSPVAMTTINPRKETLSLDCKFVKQKNLEAISFENEISLAKYAAGEKPFYGKTFFVQRYLEDNGLKGRFEHAMTEWLQLEIDDVIRERRGRRIAGQVQAILQEMEKKYDDRATLFNILDEDEIHALAVVDYEDASAISPKILKLKIAHIMEDIKEIELRLRMDSESWEYRSNILDYLRYYSQLPTEEVSESAREVLQNAIQLILEHIEVKYNLETTPNMLSMVEQDALLTIRYTEFESKKYGLVIMSLYWKFMQDDVHEMINRLRFYPSSFSLSEQDYIRLEYFTKSVTIVPEEVSSLASGLLHAVRSYNAENGGYIVEERRKYLH